MGTVYHLGLEPAQPEKAQEMYVKALETADFASLSEEAWTHARLGQVYYKLGEGASRAENEILDALDLQPDEKWIHVVLGDLYRVEGRVPEAVESYEQALSFDSGFEGAQKRLEKMMEDK
jgi:tetratricopeptide (TPR) repeat protein